MRSKVEYVFHIIKNTFGFRKTPHKGLKKLKTKAFMLAACANIYMPMLFNPTLNELPREQYA